MAAPLMVSTAQSVERAAQNAVVPAQNVTVVALSAAVVRNAVQNAVRNAARNAVRNVARNAALNVALNVAKAPAARYPRVFEWEDLKPVSAAPAPPRFFDLADHLDRLALDDPAGAFQVNLLRSGPRASPARADETPLARLDYFLLVGAD